MCKDKCKCLICLSEFKPKVKNPQYCSIECAGIAKRKIETRHCIWCDSTFEIQRCRTKKYCNNDCQIAYENSKKDPHKYTNCNNCGTKFGYPRGTWLKRTRPPNYCSPECKKVGTSKCRNHIKITFNCVNCDKIVTRSRPTKFKFCDKKCKNEYNKSLIPEIIKFSENKNCLHCGLEFRVTRYNENKRWCSSKCRFEYSRFHSWINQKCANEDCGIVIKTHIKRINKLRFCSHRCQVIHFNVNNPRTNIPAAHVGPTKPELLTELILNELSISYIFQYRIDMDDRYKLYDFYLPDYECLIEVDGIYWHGRDITYDNMNHHQKKAFDNDKIKNKLAVDSGYTLIRLWEDEIDINTIKSFLNI